MLRPLHSRLEVTDMQEKDVTLSGEQETAQANKPVGAPLTDAVETTCCIVGS